MTINTMLLLASATGLCGPVMISEVMYHPEVATEPNEFVEIINLSNDIIDLSGWRIADTYHVDDLAGKKMILGPGEYAVIFEADYDTTYGTYHDLLNPHALILTVDDYAIGNGLSNSGDSLFLLNQSGDTVDMMGWIQDMTPGHSLEKVILDSCGLPHNWRNSTTQHGTPGGQNSVAAQLVDLAFTALEWQAGVTPTIFRLTTTIVNQGLIEAGGQILAGNDVVVTFVPILPKTSQRVTFSWQAPVGFFGLYTLDLELANPMDYDTTNNYIRIDLPVPTSDMAVVINEIMYSPLPDEPEWIELVNTTLSMVRLMEWQIHDQTTGTILPDVFLPIHEYAVITGDSTGLNTWPEEILVIVSPGFPSLNNSGDIVRLIDPTERTIDEVDYSPLPITATGRSLEKISPTADPQHASSWVVSPAAEGHTAGKPNSVQIPADQKGVTIDPNPLQINTPTSLLVVTYATPFPAANLSIDIYDLAGRRLGTVANTGPVPGTGVITWDARSKDPIRYKTGQYILLFRAHDTGTNRRWERMERLILVH